MSDAFDIKRELMMTVRVGMALRPKMDGSSKKDGDGGHAVPDDIIPVSMGAAEAVPR